MTDEGQNAAKSSATVDVPRDVLEALRLLHPDFRNYGHYFSENLLKEAVAAAFERYENRLNEIRDTSRRIAIKSVSGQGLPHKLFNTKLLRLPYRKLGLPRKRSAYESALCAIMTGSLGWIRNAYTHEKHNLPEPKPGEVLELLFVASYLMRMLDYSLAEPK